MLALTLPQEKLLQCGLNCSSVLAFPMRLFFFEIAENLHAGLFLERAFYLEDFTFIRRGELGSSLLLHLCPWAWDDGSPEGLVSCGVGPWGRGM